MTSTTDFCRPSRPPFRGGRAAACLLCALAAHGCSKAPPPPPPAIVYVSALALAHFHPQWSDVELMDRQIAMLARFAPHIAGGTRAGVLDPAFPPPSRTEVNVADLARIINARLDAVRDRQVAALLARLERSRTVERAPEVAAAQSKAVDDALARLGELLPAFALRLANLYAKLAAIDSNLRQRPVWPPTGLPEQRDATLNDIEAARAELARREAAIFADLRVRLAAVEEGRTASDLKWLQQRREAVDALAGDIQNQRQVLLAALRDVRPLAPAAPVPPVAGAPVSTPPAAYAESAPLPAPQVGAGTTELRRQRAELAAFVLQNIRAIIKSAAARRGQTVVFDPQPAGTPDRTQDFREAVLAGGGNTAPLKVALGEDGRKGTAS